MKVLAYVLTAAAMLIGADVFMSSAAAAQSADVIHITQGPVALHGGNGMPTPPPDKN